MSETGVSSRPLSEIIAERLTQAYLESGRRQRDIGDEAGISQSQMSKYLRGVRAPNVDELEAICAALELDVADVVTMAVRQARRRT
ncbi:helix-turn-helix domain-containing protein [Streptomyces albidoflavus]